MPLCTRFSGPRPGGERSSRIGPRENTGGSLVFEIGGKANVAEIQSSFTTAVLLHAEFSIEEGRQACPWYFPNVEWMRQMLGEAGFDMEKCESEFRPTRLNPETKDGSSGIGGWLRLMGARFLEAVGGVKSEGALKEVCDVLGSAITRKAMGYVSLRTAARKR